MSRGLLSDSDLETIAADLTPIEDLQLLVGSMAPDMIAMAFGSSSDVSQAAPCLQDALSAVEECRYAHNEALAHNRWYLDRSDPPCPDRAAYFAKFYLDDLALRLYAAGERLADAILFMLELDPSAIQSSPAGDHVSRQSAVGQYLLSTMPDHPVTIAVRELVQSSPWPAAMQYRNTWVHEQPPLIGELGSSFRRGSRWQPDSESGGYRLVLVSGDLPHYSISEIQGMVVPSLQAFVTCFRQVADYYRGQLEERRLEISGEGVSVSG